VTLEGYDTSKPDSSIVFPETGDLVFSTPSRINEYAHFGFVRSVVITRSLPPGKVVSDVEVKPIVYETVTGVFVVNAPEGSHT